MRSLGPPYEHAYTHFEGERWDVLATEPILEPAEYCAVPGHVVARLPNGPITVATGSGLLTISKVRRAEEVVAPGDLIRSIRKRLGRDLEAEITALRERVSALEDELRAEGR